MGKIEAEIQWEINTIYEHFRLIPILKNAPSLFLPMIIDVKQCIVYGIFFVFQ
jgi:hypothetical protein